MWTVRGFVSSFGSLLLFAKLASATPFPPHILKVADFAPAGPVELHGTSKVDQSEWQRLSYRKVSQKILLPVIRIESYGKSQFTFKLLAPHRGFSEQVFLAVEGPFRTAEEADAKAIGTGDIIFSKNCSKSDVNCELSLGEPGVYRIYAVPKSIWEKSDSPMDQVEEGSHMLVRLLTVCSANCHRPTMNWHQFAAYVNSKKDPALWSELPEKVAQQWELQPAQAERVKALFMTTIAKIRADIADRPDARFPVFGPPAKLGKLQEVLLAADVSKPIPLHQVKGNLDELLKNGSADRERKPKPFIEKLPELSYGHFIDNKMSEQELRHSRVVAAIMSALSEPKRETDSGIDVVMDDGTPKRIKTILEFYDYLIKTGHTVEVRDERTYANFFAIRIGNNTDSVFPPWLDSGLALKDKSLVAPMGHSQHAWRIWGPKINARVAFFLGITGAGFFPAIDSRPLWTGMRALRTFDSYDESSFTYLTRSLMFANYYLERNRKERDFFPEDGYFLFGVCNDANAFVSYGASDGKYEVSAYPLFRLIDAKMPRSLDDKISTPILARIPHDVELDLSGGVGSKDGKDVLRRLYQMNPHDLGSPWYPDKLLKDQMNDIPNYL